MSKILQNVIFWLKHKDDILYRQKGIRRCWIVNSIDDVFCCIKNNHDLLCNLNPRTFDFTTMYLSLPHSVIFKNIYYSVNEAIMHSQQFLCDEKLKSRSLPNLQRIMSYVRFIVCNTFITNIEGNLIQQVVGIPMGTNSAPAIANLTLYASEAQFMDTLYRIDPQNAKKYAFTFRYIDDCLLWDVEPPPTDVYQLFYSETTLEDRVNFLGGTIQKCNNKLYISVYDKTVNWDLPIIRFPHYHSNTPSHQIIGVMLGQFTRYYRICNTVTSFKVAATNLILRILHRGHSYTTIIKSWKRFITKHNNSTYINTNKINKWFKKMIFWAHCNLNDPNFKPLVRYSIPVNTCNNIDIQNIHQNNFHDDSVDTSANETNVIVENFDEVSHNNIHSSISSILDIPQNDDIDDIVNSINCNRITQEPQDISKRTSFPTFPPPNNILFRYCIHNDFLRDLHSLMHVAIRNYDIQMNYPQQFFCPKCFQPFQQLHKHHGKTCQNIQNMRDRAISLLS